ncbi:sulfite oxidase, mitochondrial [Nitrospirota bacterium]|nr:sulfite oxidase, mitochondrial [Nitrospirota bacterium]
MPFSRRTILKATGLGALTALTGGCDAVGSVFGRMFAIPSRDTTYFTSNAKFYVVNYADSAVSMTRDVDIEQWKVRVKGEVKNATGARLARHFEPRFVRSSLHPYVHRHPTGRRQYGHRNLARHLAQELLQEAGADEEETSRDVIFRGIDGYDDSIPFTRAMQDDVMLAFLMNGEKLPKEHGFPIRLIVPGLYGIKNVKWITEIEVYPGDYKGYWQRKGWTDDGTIKIFSRIDSPGHYQTIRGQEQEFRGIAFGGPNSISKVELSFDAGRTWSECTIEPPMSPYSWVIWSYAWKPPKRGKFQPSSARRTQRGSYRLQKLSARNRLGPQGSIQSLPTWTRYRRPSPPSLPHPDNLVTCIRMNTVSVRFEWADRSERRR